MNFNHGDRLSSTDNHRKNNLHVPGDSKIFILMFYCLLNFFSHGPPNRICVGFVYVVVICFVWVFLGFDFCYAIL